MSSVFKKLYDGIVLISLGIILLLNVTGYVDWNIWLFYLNFWPLLIIIAGIKLILSVKKGLDIIGYLFQIVLWIAVIFGGLYYFKSNNVTSFLGSKTEYTEELVTDNQDIDKLVNFDLNLPYGEFYIYDTDNITNSYLFVDGEYSNRIGAPTITKDIDNNIVNISYDQTNGAVFYIPFINIENNFDIEIRENTINELNIDLGAGDLTTDLRYTEISNLITNIGAGEANISIGGQSEISNATLKIGAGKLHVTLDENLGYNITYHVGAGSIILEGEQAGGLGSSASNIKSSNILSAVNIININADIGAGELIIDYASE